MAVTDASLTSLAPIVEFQRETLSEIVSAVNTACPEKKFLFTPGITPKGDFAAFDVCRPQKVTDIDIATHLELCLVKDKKWLLRQLGGVLLTEIAAKAWLRPGQIVEARVKPTDRGAWRGFHLNLIADSLESFRGPWRNTVGCPVFPSAEPSNLGAHSKTLFGVSDFKRSKAEIRESMIRELEDGRFQIRVGADAVYGVTREEVLSRARQWQRS